MNEKKKIKFHRLFWFMLTILIIVTPIGIYHLISNIYYWEYWYYLIYPLVIITMIVGAFPFAFFIASLFLSYKEYEYEGKIISIYAGFYHHTLKIDGELYDEHNTFISYGPIYLSCTLENGDELFVTISKSNSIALKINDKLYTKYKQK